MRETRGVKLVAALLLSMGVTACQEPGQPGPMERAGAYIDRGVTDAQRGVADFSQRAGQSLDQAGRSVGAGAQRIGGTLHDQLVPAADTSPPPAPDAWRSRSLVSTNNGNDSSGGTPQPTRMGP
jgi:hypothetical protein